MMWPAVDKRTLTLLLALCVIALCVGAGLALFPGGSRDTGPTRQWSTLGIGQGWLETGVRNNKGARLLVSCNPGDTADKVFVQVSYPGRHTPRRSEEVELTFEVGARLFEWNVPDEGGREFCLDSATWQGLLAVQNMIAEMRIGHDVRVRVHELGLDTTFTLAGAFDVLKDAAELGQENN